MAELIANPDPEGIRAAMAGVLEEVGQACLRSGRDPAGVEVVTASKYVAPADMGALAEAGITLVGENRAQDMAAKAQQWPGSFEFDFIGHLQSRKVKDVVPLARLIHSVASDSVLGQLERHGTPETRVLVQVNVAGEDAKDGISPLELPGFIARCPVPVVGLSTMPPFAGNPEESRPWFARLAELAAENGLEELSMGTTQDFPVAVEEGATLVRVGSRILR